MLTSSHPSTRSVCPFTRSWITVVMRVDCFRQTPHPSSNNDEEPILQKLSFGGDSIP